MPTGAGADGAAGFAAFGSGVAAGVTGFGFGAALIAARARRAAASAADVVAAVWELLFANDSATAN